MGDAVIKIQGLGKRYPINAGRKARYGTLREALASLPRRMLRGERGGGAEEFWALREVSFEVARGDVLGIIGRNGAGKSTLLKVLSRIVEPSCGEAEIRGRVGSLLEVGTGFHPELTGRENIFLSGAILGMRRAEVRSRLDEIVAFSGVERFLDTPCKHYSSGMYARLGFAVAAHLPAEILLLDEVLAVGDAEFQRRCLGKVQEVRRDGRTVLFVSHDLAAVARLTGRCLWLDAGGVKACGPTAEVLAGYHRTQAPGSFADDACEATRAGVRFVRARAESEDGPGVVRMGGTLRLQVELSAGPDRAGGAVSLAFGLRADNGTPIALMAEADSGHEKLSPVGASRRLEIRIADLRLYPGTYWFRLWVGDASGLETLDDRPDAVCVQVLDNPGINGRRLLPEQGFLFLRPHWEFAPAEPVRSYGGGAT